MHITNGLRSLVERIATDNLEVVVVDYNGQFDSLWRDPQSLWSSQNSGDPGSCTVVMLWDDRALEDEDEHALRDRTALARHLTPLDFVLALSSGVLRGDFGEDVPKLRFRIVDLTGKDHHQAWSLSARGLLLPQLPWVRLYAPLLPRKADGMLAAYRRDYWPLLDETGTSEDALLLKHGDGWRLAGGDIPFLSAKGSETSQLQRLSRLWASEVSGIGDHHDLSNIIGPWVIMGDAPSVESRYIAALYRKLLWSGFVGGQARAGMQAGGDGKDFSQPLDIWLVDDHWFLGWDAVLHDLLGTSEIDLAEGEPDVDEQHESYGLPDTSGIEPGDGELDSDPLHKPLLSGAGGETRVWASESPGWLLDAIGKLEDLPARMSTRRYDSPLPKRHGVSAPWLLVLDLHLLSGTAEIEFFGKLLERATQLPADKSGWAWRGFDADELAQIKGWLNSPDRSAATYDLALSLLPRLCALRWPAVPILIFSGTGRRALVARLADYGNIFVVDRKPDVLAGNPADQIKAFRGSFDAEYRRALQLVEVQRALMALSQKKPVQTVDSQWRHLVIAMDETGKKGKPPSAIGGAMLVSVPAVDEQQAIASAHSWLEGIRNSGAHYYNVSPYYAETGTSGAVINNFAVKVKGDNCRNELGAAVKNQQGKLVAFRFKLKRAGGETGEFRDGAFLRGLSNMLETILAEYMESAGFDRKKTSCTIWLASKLSGDNDANEKCAKYDFRHEHNLNKVETIAGFGSAYQVLLRAVGARRCFNSATGQLKAIKTRKIPYSRSPIGYQSSLHWYCPKCELMYYPRNAPENNPVNKCQARENNQIKHRHQDMIADYSVLQHLADEFIKHEGEFGNGYGKFLTKELCFDVDEKDLDGIAPLLQSARLYDDEDPDGAFRLAYNHAFFDKGVGGEGMVRLERRLVAELAQYAGSVSGNTLVNLAGLASRMAERAPATGGHAEKRDAKPKQASQSTPQPGAADWKSKAGQKRGNRGATAYPGGGKKKQQDNAMPRVFLSRLGDDIVDEEGVKKLVDCLLAKASVAVEGVVVEAKKAFSSKKFNCTLTGLTSDQADALAKVSRKAGHHCDIGGKG